MVAALVELKRADDRFTREPWLFCWWRFSSLESPVSMPESSSPTPLEEEEVVVTEEDEEDDTGLDSTISLSTSVTWVKKSGTPS